MLYYYNSIFQPEIISYHNKILREKLRYYVQVKHLSLLFNPPYKSILALTRAAQ